MYKVKVITNKLNIRNTPTADPEYKNWAGELLKGDEFTATDIIEGQVYNNSPYWYKDEYNRFASLTGIGDDDPRIGWSLRTLGVPHIWVKTKGEGVTVAVVDSGVDLHNSDLSDAVLAAYSYNSIDESQNVQASYYHGNFCASIIASRGRPNGLLGVAPACKLIVIKITDEESIDDANELKGYQKLLEIADSFDIISLSIGSPQEKPLIKNILEKLINAGKICIAASGDDPNPAAGVCYPANTIGMISVGSIKCTNETAAFGNGIFEISDQSSGGAQDGNHEGVTIVAPGDGVNTYDIGGKLWGPISGTSYAVPYVAGVAALWLSTIKKKNISIKNYHKSFKDFLITNSIKTISGYTSNYCGAGIISPSKILSL